MKEHEIYYVYEEFRWQGNWTSAQWPLRISYTDLYLANLLACRSQSPPAEGLQHLKILFSFAVWRQPQKTCETNAPLKNIENWKKCTNAWDLDSPPTSKFKTLKKINSIQFESPTCSYTLRPSRVKWRQGDNLIFTEKKMLQVFDNFMARFALFELFKKVWPLKRRTHTVEGSIIYWRSFSISQLPTVHRRL